MKNQNVNFSLFSILTFAMLMTINSNSYGSTKPKIKWEKIIEWKRVYNPKPSPKMIEKMKQNVVFFKSIKVDKKVLDRLKTLK
jgi:hypothetical protein